jgi:hypothetical protein
MFNLFFFNFFLVFPFDWFVGCDLLQTTGFSKADCGFRTLETILESLHVNDPLRNWVSHRHGSQAPIGRRRRRRVVRWDFRLLDTEIQISPFPISSMILKDQSRNHPTFSDTCDGSYKESSMRAVKIGWTTSIYQDLVTRSSHWRSIEAINSKWRISTSLPPPTQPCRHSTPWFTNAAASTQVTSKILTPRCQQKKDINSRYADFRRRRGIKAAPYPHKIQPAGLDPSSNSFLRSLAYRLLVLSLCYCIVIYCASCNTRASSSEAMVFTEVKLDLERALQSHRVKFVRAGGKRTGLYLSVVGKARFSF